MKQEKIRCDACPILCFIAEGKSGACDRYANQNGKVIRLDPLIILNNKIEKGEEVKPFLKSNFTLFAPHKRAILPVLGGI